MSGPSGAVGLPLATSVVVGAATFLSVVVAARALGPGAYATFAVVWGCFFGIGGALAGLQQEVTRALLVGGRTVHVGEPVLLLRRVLPVAATLATVGGVVVVLTTDRLEVGVSVAVGLVGLGVMTMVGGVLAAEGEWRAACAVLLADAASRTVAVCAAVVLLDDRTAVLAVTAGAVLWTVLLLVRSVREATCTRTAQPAGDFLSRCVTGMLAAGCASLLIAGFPLVLALVSPPGAATSGELLAVLVLVRSPVLMVVFAYRPLLLHHLVASPEVARGTGRLLGGLALVAVPVLAGAAVLGPAVVRLVVGTAYQVPRVDLVLITVSGLLLAAMVVTGLALVATDRYLHAALGWVAALVATALTVTALPVGDAQVLVAGLVGPAVGLVLHLGALARTAQSSPSENADSRSWRE